MDERRTRRTASGKWRALSLLLIGLLAGSLMLGTASAHLGSFNHLKQHFYTKQKADKRFARKSHWVYVRGSDGNIIATSGGISVARGFAGGYYLSFPVKVTNKAIVATPAYATATGDANVTANACGGAPLGVTCLVGPNTNKDLFVHTTDLGGTNVDRNFYVAVLP